MATLPILPPYQASHAEWHLELSSIVTKARHLMKRGNVDVFCILLTLAREAENALHTTPEQWNKTYDIDRVLAAYLPPPPRITLRLHLDTGDTLTTKLPEGWTAEKGSEYYLGKYLTYGIGDGMDVMSEVRSVSVSVVE